jgi:hypothetical protein
MRGVAYFPAMLIGLLQLAACTSVDMPLPDSFSVSVWVDSDPNNHMESQAIFLASGVLTPHPEYAGLYSMAGPLKAALPSGLVVEVTCERVSTGHFHCGTSHSGELVTVGKYQGPFTVRLFPPGHQSYVLDVKEGQHQAGGT